MAALPAQQPLELSHCPQEPQSTWSSCVMIPHRPAQSFTRWAWSPEAFAFETSAGEEELRNHIERISPIPGPPEDRGNLLPFYLPNT